MGVDFVAVATMSTVADALTAIRDSAALQPEALTSVHAGLRCRPGGVARLVTLVQSDPVVALIDVCDTARSASARTLTSWTWPC